MEGVTIKGISGTENNSNLPADRKTFSKLVEMEVAILINVSQLTSGNHRIEAV
jgi:hypothetical protein